MTTNTRTPSSISSCVDRLVRQTIDLMEYVDTHDSIRTRQFYMLAALAGDLKRSGWYGGDLLVFRHSLAMAITECPDSSAAERLLAIHSSLLDWERAWADNNN
jgi:hypothetical protein